MFRPLQAVYVCLCVYLPSDDLVGGTYVTITHFFVFGTTAASGPVPPHSRGF
jgi:hypothetical protein